jgi:HlyD family secretion protein
MAKRKNNRLIWFILGGVILLLIIVGIIRNKQKPKGLEVEIEKVEFRTIHETVGASGKIFPEKEVKISSDVSGEIIELEVEEGDSVFAGQVLAVIDPEAYESAVERGQATLDNTKSQLAMSRSEIQSAIAQREQIEAQLENARTIHDRNKKLLEDEVISQQEFETSLSNVRQLEANLRSAEARYKSAVKSAEAAEYSVKSTQASLKELKTNLDRTTIQAPTDGVISLMNVEEGERVVGTIQMTGTELMRIANFNSMEVQVEVSENDILRVSLGDTADIEVDAYYEKTFKGVVSEIASTAANVATAQGASLTSDQVTNFIVKIRILQNSYEDLLEETRHMPFRPGMSASVDIYTETVRDVPSLPIQAVAARDLSEKKDEEDTVEEEDGELTEVVFQVLGDTVKMVKVETGIQDNRYIHIVSGVEQGDEVVTGPYSAVSRKLEEGDEVRRKEKKKEKKDGEEDNEE